MDLLSPLSVRGHVIELQRSDPRHLSGSGAAGSIAATAGPEARLGPESGFGKLFFDALNNVNDLQHTTMDLTEAMLTDPDSVDIHDVTVAIAEANLALSMTKAIMDRAIRAYQEVINIR
ncbi:MAG: flagellar hook-basal body complex protein FliE [Spirochaetaceae bacterium]|nr:MAG: flagellar hook-basal body complex protein FliE [Spirochaetaceae bacterium]